MYHRNTCACSISRFRTHGGNIRQGKRCCLLQSRGDQSPPGCFVQDVAIEGTFRGWMKNRERKETLPQNNLISRINRILSEHPQPAPLVGKKTPRQGGFNGLSLPAANCTDNEEIR